MADILGSAPTAPVAPVDKVTTVPDYVPVTIRRTRKRRRPTGAPAPLPRKLGLSGSLWLGMMAWIAIVTVLLLRFDPVLHLSNDIETWWMVRVASIRSGWLTHIMRAVKIAGSSWGVTVLGLGLVGLLMIYRRWRHLLVFLGSLFVMQIVGGIVYDALTRPRPYGVAIISGWGGFAMPSPPVATLAAILIGITYTLLVAGRPRWYAKIATAGVLLLFVFAREYLGVDGPGDALYGVVLGVAIPLTAFRFFTPNEVFPVAYRKGKAAHLDVSGRRGQTILYGALEDEASFQSVRRFVEYEDYTLRLMHDEGIPVPRPFGIVEITPEREYMIVMEFFAGAVEIGEAEVDDRIIDDGLALVRKLWDAGLAHRDIKPANLMVRDEQVLLIDAFFVQVKPSPWRQAVDLGNMMLVLAVRSNPEDVYQHALKFFTESEIAEAFAATCGMASPTQLRAFMKRDPRDLLAKFRSLAPERRPIAIQRWSVRRVVLAAGMLLVFVIAADAGVKAFFPAQNPAIPRAPECGPNHTTILSAQAVPSAAALPCLAALPTGWAYGGGDIHSGQARFWLSSDQAGWRAVTITLTKTCDVSRAHEVPSDEAGARRFEKPTSLTPELTDVRSYVFPGGCVTYRFAFASGAPTALVFDVDAAVSSVPRADVVAFVRDTEDLALCGRGVPCVG